MAQATISTRQNQILNFLQQHVDKKGYPPSVREIGKAVGLSSSSTVHSHLAVLENKGFIKRDAAKPRALELIGTKKPKPSTDVTSLPLIGQIAAGSPVIAEENIESYIPMPAELVRGDFILKVKGNSMIEAGILDGDYIVVRQQPVAQNGQAVVALLDDEATVKTYFKEKDCIRLQPENSSMEPIITKDAVILGVVVAILRKL